MLKQIYLNKKKAKNHENQSEYIIEEKHKAYNIRSNMFKYLYYISSLVVGISAACLPFVLDKPLLIKILSMIIVMTTVLDRVFNFKSKWELYSRATDILTIKRLEQSSDYYKYKEAIELLIETESKSLENNLSLKQLIKSIDEVK